MCEPKNSAAIYMKQKLTKLKEEIDKPISIVENDDTLLLVIDVRLNRKLLNMQNNKMMLGYAISLQDLSNTNRTFNTRTAEDILFSSINKTYRPYPGPKKKNFKVLKTYRMSSLTTTESH